MIQELTDYQNTYVNRLFKSAIAVSNLSLNKIIDSPVRIREISVELKSTDDTFVEADQEFVQVLKTPLIGELKGESFLFLTESDIDSIYAACLSAEVHTDDSPSAEIMKDGLLTEIANMMVSAFVTEIADTLDLEIYCTVPSQETLDFIRSSYKISSVSDEGSKQCLVVKASLQAKALEISPEFVWLLPESFLRLVKEREED